MALESTYRHLQVPKAVNQARIQLHMHRQGLVTLCDRELIGASKISLYVFLHSHDMEKSTNLADIFQFERTE